MLTRHNLDDSRELIAKRILAKANGGDRDEWNLARHAIQDFLVERVTHSAKEPASPLH